MTDPLQNILQQTGTQTPAFPANSRYYKTEIATKEGPTGENRVFLRRRFISLPERFSLLYNHSFSQGERLDNIANQHLGDPELFWRICDGNGVLHPDELTETTGTEIKITLSEGIPGF